MPYVEETITRRSLTSDLTGRTAEVTDKPEPYKWPAAKDMPTLYVHENEAEALNAFLTGDIEPLKALFAAPAKASNGKHGGSAFAGTVREWGKSANVTIPDRGRVPEDAYEAYFRANMGATPPDDATDQAKSAYAKVHPAPAE